MLDYTKEISKPDPHKSKKQLWELQKGLYQSYTFREDLTYGKRPEPTPDPFLPVNRTDTYYATCRHTPEDPPVLQAYPPRVVAPLETVQREKFMNVVNLEIKGKPRRCFLELD